MTRSEFEKNQKAMTCKFCGEYALGLENSPQHPGGGIRCGSCGKFQFWLAKDRAEDYRPKLPRGTSPQVWSSWGGCCAHCGLSERQLSLLGIGRTIQHVPPFKETHQTEYLIPLCDWCQQDSATRMKRLQTLVQRLNEKFALT